MEFFKTFVKTPVKEAQTVAVTAIKTEVTPPDDATLDSLPTNIVDITAVVEDVQEGAADKLGDVVEDTTDIAIDATSEVIVIATNAAGTLTEEITDVIMPDDDKLPWFVKLVNCCGGNMAFLKLTAKHAKQAASKVDTDDLPGSAASIATTVTAVLPATAVTSGTLSSISGLTAAS